MVPQGRFWAGHRVQASNHTNLGVRTFSGSESIPGLLIAVDIERALARDDRFGGWNDRF